MSMDTKHNKQNKHVKEQMQKRVQSIAYKYGTYNTNTIHMYIYIHTSAGPLEPSGCGTNYSTCILPYSLCKSPERQKKTPSTPMNYPKRPHDAPRVIHRAHFGTQE